VEDEAADGLFHGVEDFVRVEEGDFEEEEVLGEVEESLAFGGGAALGEPFGVADAVADEEVRFVEHADESEDVLDAEASFGELLLEESEEVAGGFFAVELGDEEVFDGLEAEVAEGGGVLDDEAELAVEELGGDEQVGAEGGDGAVGGLGADGYAEFFVVIVSHSGQRSGVSGQVPARSVD
jgi:hypothetical protein